MSSRESILSAEDYNFMNSTETMDCVSSNVTIVSNELNIDTSCFADMIANFNGIENYTNRSVYSDLCLEEFDKVLSTFEKQYDKYKCHNGDLNYNILDLDNLEYITYKNGEYTAFNSDFNIRSDIQYYLYEHNYCIRKEATNICKETIDASKLRDSNQTEENSFTDIPYFHGVDYVGEFDESPQFCFSECNLQELNVETGNFEIIPNKLSIDKISVYTISDDEHTNDDIDVPELDVISISSGNSTEDINNESDSNSCGYHSSDFEFIEEHEAIKNGLLLNYNKQTIKEEKVKTIDIAKEYNSSLILDYFNIPVSNNIEYKIPQDTNYINMFERNIPYPVQCMENKSVYTNNYSMNADYQDVGFNMSVYSRQKVDEHVQDEANKSEDKIIFMYPSENRRLYKRRRT